MAQSPRERESVAVRREDAAVAANDSFVIPPADEAFRVLEILGSACFVCVASRSRPMTRGTQVRTIRPGAPIRRTKGAGSDAAQTVGALEDEARVGRRDDRMRRQVIGHEGAEVCAVAPAEVDDEVFGPGAT